MNNIYVAPGVPVTIVSGNITINMKNRKEKKMRKNEMGICPKCGADHTGMTDYEMDLDCLWTKWECHTCGESWSEYATLIYDGYVYDNKTYDADGKECTDI